MSDPILSHFVRDTVLRIVIILIILIGALSIIAFFTMERAQSSDVHILSISTEKDVYHSKEMMNISVIVISATDIDNLTLVVEGLEDQFGKVRLTENRSISLVAGRNAFEIQYIMPFCSRCAGLPPSDYTINVTVLEHDIAIEQGFHRISIE